MNFQLISATPADIKRFDFRLEEQFYRSRAFSETYTKLPRQEFYTKKYGI